MIQKFGGERDFVVYSVVGESRKEFGDMFEV